MKYLSVKIEGKETAIVFGENMGHDEVARALIHTPGMVILGAGNFSLGDEDVGIYSGSVSLKMEPHKDDKFLLRQLFFPY